MDRNWASMRLTASSLAAVQRLFDAYAKAATLEERAGAEANQASFNGVPLRGALDHTQLQAFAELRPAFVCCGFPNVPSPGLQALARHPSPRHPRRPHRLAAQAPRRRGPGQAAARGGSDHRSR